VLGWSMAICLLTGIVVGLGPAITMARQNLRLSTRGVAMRKVRSGLVVTEFALAVILLVGAGLLIRSLWSVKNVDPGFKPERVLSAQLSVPASRSDAQRIDFYGRVLEQISLLPGVENAGIIGDLFIGGNAEQIITVERSDRTV